jgi:hypothetical protein
MLGYTRSGFTQNPVIPAVEPGSLGKDLGSARVALDRDDKITKLCVSPIAVINVIMLIVNHVFWEKVCSKFQLHK